MDRDANIAEATLHARMYTYGLPCLHKRVASDVQATGHFMNDLFIPRASSKGAVVVVADVDYAGTSESSNIGALPLFS